MLGLVLNMSLLLNFLGFKIFFQGFLSMFFKIWIFCMLFEWLLNCSVADSNVEICYDMGLNLNRIFHLLLTTQRIIVFRQITMFLAGCNEGFAWRRDASFCFRNFPGFFLFRHDFCDTHITSRSLQIVFCLCICLIWTELHAWRHFSPSVVWLLSFACFWSQEAYLTIKNDFPHY